MPSAVDEMCSKPTTKPVTNGNSMASGTLPKLSSARDLTLGGRGSIAPNAKKVFTPNLNVVRKKNANVKTSKDTTARGGRGRGRGKTERGGRGGHSALIQTAGVFSEGAGAVGLRKATSSSSSYTRNDDALSVSAMRKPTFNKSIRTKSDLKADEAQIREILGDSEEDELEAEKTDLEQKPIRLNDVKWKYVKPIHKFETKDAADESCNKIDDNEDESSALALTQKIQLLHVKLEQKFEKLQQRSLDALPSYPKSIVELLESPKPQILVLQLPDTLPCEDECLNSSEISAEVATKMSTTTAATISPNIPAIKSENKSSTLKQMDEGQIGKILRYKSGKVKLLLGECYFDLNIGMETGFLQDLMSITTNREERSGNMINLGPIEAKLTASPDWEHLLQ